MQITDPIADLLTRIRNASTAKHPSVDVPASNLKKAICQILVDEGYIKGMKVTDDGKQGVITLTLKYQENGAPVIDGLKRVSKPGLRIYTNCEDMPKVMKGLGTAIISTSKTMSRIGRKPIVIPAGVEVKVDEADHAITVKGPKGTLHSKFHPMMTVKVEGNEILVTRPNDEKEARSLHGLTRTNIHNMVVGVTEGFRKDLEIQGVGYRCAKQGSKLVLTLGFSHPVEVAETETIKIEVKDALHFSILGSDKQEVGQFAAEVRSKRPPEPYKGKGIRYVGEFVIRKEGKAGKGK